MRKNLVWAGMLRAVIRGFTLLKTLVLARLLLPSQFGTYGIGLLILGLLEMLTETGVNVVLVQERKNIDKFVNTAWVVSIVRGILISFIIVLLTPFIANFFNNPESTTFLYWTSLIPLIRGFINPSIVKYQRELEFNKEFWFKSCLVAIDVVTSLIFCFIYRSELALISGMVLSALIEVVVSNIVVSPKPKIEFDKDKLIHVVNKGKWITGAKIFDYLFSHGDDIVVGKILGTASLGIYQQAYRISSLPTTEVAEVFQRVTFPYFAKNSTDQKAVIKIYLKSITWTLVFILPVGIILFLFPHQVVQILLGENWLSVAPVIRVLAIFAVIKTITNSVFPILLGINRQDLVAYLTLTGILGLGISIYPLVNMYGLVGAAYSTIIGSVVMILPAVYWLSKFLNNKNKND